MKTFTGTLAQAKSIVEWLHINVAKNVKPNMSPSYGSWLNNTLRWDAANRSWYLEFKPRTNLIIIECDNDEIEFMTLFLR